MLDVLQDKVMVREIRFANVDIEAACLIVYPPRLRTTCCAIVCRSGGGGEAFFKGGSVKSVYQSLLDWFEEYVFSAPVPAPTPVSSPAPAP